jgi:hypothetical protein
METSMEFLKKLEVELPYDPAIPLLGMCKGMQAHIQQTPAHPCEQQDCSLLSSSGSSPGVHQLMNDKENVVYPHSGVLFSH